jgi:HD-GYP domain-containing protein (c-di-GMP phosphodiesterase class II)
MESLIQVLESTLAARDPYTVAHQRRVTQIACTIGREMGLSEDRLDELRIAGSLHDLGKIAVPASLLSKPGKLTTLEFALIKTHPQVGYNILKPIKLPGNTTEIILQHHERLDGSGYPQGLKGNEILLEARILGVADVMEAMCSHRPYRASLGMAESLQELVKNKGTLYDAGVVDTCLKLYGEDPLLPCDIGSGMSPRPLGTPQPQVPLEEAAQVAGEFTHLSTLPLRQGGKRKSWAKVHRSWMHLGTTFLMGFLIPLSFRGF